MSDEYRYLLERQDRIIEVIERKKKRQADLAKLVQDINKDRAELEAEFDANKLKLKALHLEGDNERI